MQPCLTVEGEWRGPLRPQNASTFPVGTVPDDADENFSRCGTSVASLRYLRGIRPVRSDFDDADDDEGCEGLHGRGWTWMVWLGRRRDQGWLDGPGSRGVASANDRVI